MSAVVPVRTVSVTDTVASLNVGTQPRLDFLDGLRAVAALFVVFHHVFLNHLNGIYASGGLRGAATNWLLYGHLAVDLFIVLSGFCLAIPVARAGFSPGQIGLFFRRRARRILPPFYGALVFSVAVYILLAHGINPEFVNMKTLAANIFLMQDFAPKAGMIFNPPLWSVAAEVKIYLLFPLLILLLIRKGPLACIAVAAVLAGMETILLQSARPEWRLDHTCPWYLLLFAGGLCAGVAAFSPTSRRFWKAAALGSLTLLCILLARFPITRQGDENYARHLLLTDIAAGAFVACALVLLATATAQNLTWRLKTALSLRPLVFVGTFAYSIYLMHMPLLGIFQRVVTRLLPGHYMTLWSLLATIPLIVAGAYLFHLACEKPFLSSRRNSASVFRFVTPTPATLEIAPSSELAPETSRPTPRPGPRKAGGRFRGR